VCYTGCGVGTSWADYDGDGDLDLYVTNRFEANVLYQNDGDGTFTDVTSAAGVGNTGNGAGTAWADYDGDGDLDLYVANDNGEANVLYQNNGDGTFTDVTSAASVGHMGSDQGPAWADYDGDGDLDLHVADYGAANVLYRNDGDGTFTDVTSSASVGYAPSSLGTAWADYDGDGDLDLYVTNSHTANVLYQNDGDGTFTDVTSSTSVGHTGNSRAAAWADYDGDGDLDLYVTNQDDQANVLYQNNGGVASITLVVKPLTDAGAPSVFGAVTLSTADGNVVALRTLDGGSGYFSQNRSVLSGQGGKDRGACIT
jgi:DNA/RNA endonuclease YhcR with UshA esterase domain